MTEIFDLGRISAQSAKDLPLGFKQRLALACAVMHEPRRPVPRRADLRRRPDHPARVLDAYQRLVEQGVTVLVTTHFMDEAEYCDRISLIYRGRSIALGSPDELKDQVADRRAARSDDGGRLHRAWSRRSDAGGRQHERTCTAHASDASSPSCRKETLSDRAAIRAAS